MFDLIVVFRCREGNGVWKGDDKEHIGQEQDGLGRRAQRVGKDKAGKGGRDSATTN